MSSSDCDDENSIEKTKVTKYQETKLETDLKLLQVKETNSNSQSSTSEEGSTAQKKFSAHNLSHEESTRNTERPEPSLRDIFPSNTVPSTQNTHSMRSTTEAGNFEADAANWRSLRSPNPKEKNESISVSSSLSWRDPHFKYERLKQNDNSSSRKWWNEDMRENRSRSFENKSTYIENRDKSKSGNWALSCAPDIVLDNGLTEVEHIQKCVNELHEQNAELFASRHPKVFQKPNGTISINCYTSNYEDKVHVAKVADILVEKIGYYPYCFLYFYGNKPLYMKTCEKEFYEFNENNFKLIDFDE
ncbi:uncharacterized protein [Parasteatoda tepidariorum]|uniref:uncharacterized protein n=1 Tax=Parasteatoda tepidariorum TaxID=114398 RepID=UPI00077F8753|nr:uncharacterized protein LOC107451363 [Parasteatoda tepidariorum]